MSRELFPNSVVRRPDGSVWSGAVFTVTMLTETAVRPDGAYPIKLLKLVTDDDGRFPADTTIPTPSSGAWKWRLRWPDGNHAGDAEWHAGHIVLWCAKDAPPVEPEPGPEPEPEPE